ncbi:hypothetical protein DITRI_Ditri15bG0064700 [Diplodiscus trichospermus]
MALTQSSQMKMLMVVLAIMVLISSAAAVSDQDSILPPLNIGRKLVARYYSTPTTYPTPSGGEAIHAVNSGSNFC